MLYLEVNFLQTALAASTKRYKHLYFGVRKFTSAAAMAMSFRESSAWTASPGKYI